jgi:hypothetical protein
VRRLELAAENFARFAMFTNTWPANGLCYSTGEIIRGLAWSNQGWMSCGTPIYYDTVGAVGTITGGSPNWIKGPLSARPLQPRIPMPTVARLAFMPTYASGASLSFTPNAGSSMRLEFEAVDVDGNGDSTGVNEGFVRAFDSRVTGNAFTDAVFRDRTAMPVWATTANPPAWTDSLCGDFHGKFFFPVVAHRVAATQTVRPNDLANVAWMNRWLRDRGLTAATDTVGASLTTFPASMLHDRVMTNATARCFPAGSPQLAAVERGDLGRRPDGTAWTEADRLKGGEDTTFTVNGRWGTWRQWPSSPLAALTTRRNNEARALFPLSKELNANYRGIVHVNGSAYVSGVVRSRVTLYASNALTFLDDLTYVTPPNAPGTPCDAATSNMLGIIAVNNVMIDENALQRPVRMLYSSSGGSNLRFMSGSGPHFRLHAVVMSLNGTVGVINPTSGPALDPDSRCNGMLFSGGCILQVGGVIEQFISGTTSGAGFGFAENRDVDQCMLETSPPYFPTTGRYLTNRYFESDPARFNPTTLFQILQSG